MLLNSPIGFKTRKNNARMSLWKIHCPLKASCLIRSNNEKKFSVTYFKEEYDRNIARTHSKQGRYMKKKRTSTVEPVFGTLTHFLGMRKVNTIGIEQANKVIHMAAIAYNLKKYLKFTQNLAQSKRGVLAFYINTALIV